MDAASAPPPPRLQKPSFLRWISLSILLVVCLVCVKLVREGRRMARNAQCRGTLGHIRLALQNRQRETGTLPPLILCDDGGNALMSWRVLLLPYFDSEERKLYSELDLSEPWNSPKNLAICGPETSHIVRWYRSPNDFGAVNSDTSFV